MKIDNILKLEINNRTKHLEKYLRSQWTWKTYTFIFSLLAALIFVILDLEINFIKLFSDSSTATVLLSDSTAATTLTAEVTRRF